LLDDRGYLDPDDETVYVARQVASSVQVDHCRRPTRRGQSLGVDLNQVSPVPAAREHVDRIARAIRDEDDPQLLGSAKERLESVSKTVLESQGEELPMKFPALVSRAIEVLKLRPKAPPTDREELVASVRTNQRIAKGLWHWSRSIGRDSAPRTPPCAPRCWLRGCYRNPHVGHSRGPGRTMEAGLA
jgi:hypothetical protein